MEKVTKPKMKHYDNIEHLYIYLTKNETKR